MEIIEQIGQGKSAKVYLANVNDKHVAVKIFDITSPEQFAQIENEVNILKYLSSPNCHKHVLCFQDFVYDDLTAQIITNHIPGEPLHGYIKMIDSLRKDPCIVVPTLNIISLCLQIAESVKFIHDKGIVHRDIKPSNIVVDTSQLDLQVATASLTGQTILKDNDICLIDFGSACTPFDIPNIAKCKIKMLGTPYFMAPEIWTDLYTTDMLFKSDIYSLGAVFYFIVNSGNPPFLAKTLDELKKLVLTLPVPSFNSGYPILDDLIVKMLSKKPIDRPNIDEVIKAISTLIPRRDN